MDISVIKAKEMVENSLKEYFPNETRPLVSNTIKEMEVGWMFFNAPYLAFPKGCMRSGEATVVSKKGTIRQVIDFSQDHEKLKQYLIDLNSYMLAKGE